MFYSYLLRKIAPRNSHGLKSLMSLNIHHAVSTLERSVLLNRIRIVHGVDNGGVGHITSFTVEGGHEEQSLYLLKTSSTSSNEPYNRQGWSRL